MQLHPLSPEGCEFGFGGLGQGLDLGGSEVRSRAVMLFFDRGPNSVDIRGQGSSQLQWPTGVGLGPLFLLHPFMQLCTHIDACMRVTHGIECGILCVVSLKDIYNWVMESKW